MKPNLNTPTDKGSQSKNEGRMKIGWSKNEHGTKHEANRPLSRLFFAVMAVMLLVGMTAKGQSVIMSGIAASFIQLYGYGCGFLVAWWKRCVLKKDEFQAFEKTFYD